MQHSRYTRLRQLADRYPSSKCFGEPLGGVKTWLQREGFEEIFQLYVFF